MTVIFSISGTQHQQTKMIFAVHGLVLGVLVISIAVRPSETVSANLGAPDSNNLNMEFSPDDAVAGGLDTSLDNSNATPLIISTPPLTTTRTRPRPLTPQSPTPTSSTVRPGTTQFRPTPRQIKIQMIPRRTTTVPSTATIMTRANLSDSKTSSPVKPVPLPLDPAISVHDSGRSPFNEPGHYHSSGNGPPQNSWPHGPRGVQYPPGDNGQQPHGAQSPRSRQNIPWWWLLMEEV